MTVINIRLTLVAATLCCGMAFGIQPAQSDQNDARLNELFAELHAPNIGIQRANELTSIIWGIWLEVAGEQENKLLNQGIKMMNEGKLEAAVKDFDRLIEVAPTFAEGWNKRATAYYLLGDTARSAEDVKHTLKLEPRHFGALSGLGLLYLQLQRPRAALEAFREALTANPHLPGPQQNIKMLEKVIEQQDKKKEQESV